VALRKAGSLRNAQRASAFAPGHVTGLFAPASSGPDPRSRGSVGAGIVLERGVEARAVWWPDGARRLTLRSDIPGPLPISLEAARRLWSPVGGTLQVELTHGLPVGQGFGMSAAGALATALCVGRLTGAPRPRAVDVAHLADLFGGGGLGGVSATLGGGLEIRTVPGVPPHGQVLHEPFPPSVFLAVTGAPMPSPPLLGDPRFLLRVADAASEGLEFLGRGPSVERFLVASERFTDRLRLGRPQLLRRIRSLRGREVAAAQAMFGSSLFAVAVTPEGRRSLVRELQRSGIAAVEMSAARQGARVRPAPGP
jgi:pantoate kinase